MILKRKLLFSTLTLLVIINLLFEYYRTFSISIQTLLVSVLMVIIAWNFDKRFTELLDKYDHLKNENNHLQIENTNVKKMNEKLLDENSTLTNKIDEYIQFFNTFDASTFFIYDVHQNIYKFSKGVENLFGYFQGGSKGNQDFFKHVKQLLHLESVDKFEGIVKDLFMGNSVREELCVLHPENGEIWLLFIAKPLKNEQGAIIKINGHFEDVTRRKELEFELRQMAFFDDLTDIPNRKMLDRQLQKALVRSKRHHHNFTIMFIDLDDFKKVNDTFGHDIGDLLLKEVVERINVCIREEDLISRIGGDEFIVMFEETDKNEIEQIAQRIISYVAEPYLINGNEAKISLSIGISMYPDDGEDKESLIQAADKAMYHAKNNGKNNYQLYTPELNDLEIADKGIFKKWVEVIQNTFKV